MSDSSFSLGFGNLPNQVQRKHAKKGYELTLMVVGESGLGKTTLINALFKTKINEHKALPSTQELLNRKLTIETTTAEMEGVKLKLTVVDTPGYGDALNCTSNYEPIVNYIDEQFERYLNNESGINRRQIRDTRVHCCFYFISPLNFGLKPADIQFLTMLQHKVNIIPLIGKSDSLSPSEVKERKNKILEELKMHKIQIYTISDCDQDEEPSYKEHVLQLQKAMPFAVCASLEEHEVKGKKVRGRLYDWGVIETENPDHSDFVKLRSLMISHLEDLRDVTNSVHYENYRAQRLLSGQISPNKLSDSTRDNVSIISGSTTGLDDGEKDRILQEKEAELKKMQDIINKMQEEMKLRQMVPEPVAINGSGHA